MKIIKALIADGNEFKKKLLGVSYLCSLKKTNLKKKKKIITV